MEKQIIMVDIHTHILPGIDDGASSWEDVYKMAAMAADSGVDIICATHHANIPGLYQNYNTRRIHELFSEVKIRLKEGGFPLRVVRGMEIFATPDVVHKIMDGRLLSLNQTNFFLIEFSFDETPAYMSDILYDMRQYHMRPVIAHPERYFCLQERPEILQEWHRAGILSQINKGSLLGRFGHNVERTALYFMKNRLISCVSSDAHSPLVRTTDMGEIRHFLERKLSKEEAFELLDRTPRRILGCD